MKVFVLGFNLHPLRTLAQIQGVCCVYDKLKELNGKFIMKDSRDFDTCYMNSVTLRMLYKLKL